MQWQAALKKSVKIAARANNQPKLSGSYCRIIAAQIFSILQNENHLSPSAALIQSVKSIVKSIYRLFSTFFA